MKKVILIKQCSDHKLWYSEMVGQEVPYVRTYHFEQIYVSREPDGYSNIVYMKDADLIVQE